MLSISDITIDAELESLLPALSEDENKELIISVMKDGFTDPLIVWLGHGKLVDGHNRYRIWQTCLGSDEDKSPAIIEKAFADLETVKDWMRQRALARRNLADAMRVKIALQRKPFLEAKAKEKQKAGGQQKAKQVSQNSDEPKRVDEQIAEAAGVSRDTVRKVETVLADGDEQTKSEMLAGKISIKAAHDKTCHVSNNSGNNEWYTPPEFIEAARNALGGTIDLDPASCELANQTIKAKRFFSIEDDGLTKEWKGRVWLNPPYGQPGIVRFIEKLGEEVTSKRTSAAVVLVNNATETDWGQSLLAAADAVCFKDGRIKFLNSEGKPANTPLQGQMFLYFGPRVAVFKEEFGKFGVCK